MLPSIYLLQHNYFLYSFGCTPCTIATIWTLCCELYTEHWNYTTYTVNCTMTLYTFTYTLYCTLYIDTIHYMNTVNYTFDCTSFWQGYQGARWTAKISCNAHSTALHCTLHLCSTLYIWPETKLHCALKHCTHLNVLHCPVQCTLLAY